MVVDPKATGVIVPLLETVAAAGFELTYVVVVAKGPVTVTGF
jgi:hypothetical protein